MSNQSQSDSNIDPDSYNAERSSQNDYTKSSLFDKTLYHCLDKRCKLPFTNVLRHKELHSNMDIECYVCEIAD